MSYCRFSTKDCDLYCYEDVSGGFTTHVAARRARPGVKDPKFPATGGRAAIVRWLREVEDNRVQIGLPYDGQSFNDPDLPSFLARVKHLKAVGYRVPDRVIREIEEEIKGA